jgi:hypothetical protein
MDKLRILNKVLDEFAAFHGFDFPFQPDGVRKTIGFDFEKQLPIIFGSSESVIPISVFIVFANALFQGVLADADVELV